MFCAICRPEIASRFCSIFWDGNSGGGGSKFSGFGEERAGSFGADFRSVANAASLSRNCGKFYKCGALIILILGFFSSVNSFNNKIQSEKAGLPRWKRTLDVGLILLALPVLIPLALLITAIIRIVSKGPILFQQERVGYLGGKFMCLKFRTMFVGADTVSHQGHLHQLINSDAPMMKMDSHGDSRIIRFGRWLRSSGLDELPQLINVLLGEMSLVGPRPCLPYESEKIFCRGKKKGSMPSRVSPDFGRSAAKTGRPSFK